MRASKKEWKDFLRSNVWKDFKKEMLLRRSEVRNILESGINSNTQERLTNDETCEERGRSKELMFLTDFPEFVVKEYEQIIESEKSEENQDKED